MAPEANSNCQGRQTLDAGVMSTGACNPGSFRCRFEASGRHSRSSGCRRGRPAVARCAGRTGRCATPDAENTLDELAEDPWLRASETTILSPDTSTTRVMSRGRTADGTGEFPEVVAGRLGDLKVRTAPVIGDEVETRRLPSRPRA